MPIRAVLFDLFDTLVDLPLAGLPRVPIAGRMTPSTSGALHEAVAARAPIAFDAFLDALAAVDREWRLSAYAEGRELPTLERFTRLAGRLGLADADLPAALTAIHMGLIADLARTPGHHAAFLGGLRGRFRLGVCSNFSHSPTALAVLDRADLRSCFDAVVISHDVGLRKPRREIFHAALDALGVAASEALHVGDNLEADVAGAAALGIRTAWVTRRVSDTAAALGRYRGPAPEFVVADLADLARILG